jgi:stringent starvation protein B
MNNDLINQVVFAKNVIFETQMAFIKETIDAGFKPYITVHTAAVIGLPSEFYKTEKQHIVLNISVEATGSMDIGESHISLSVRFNNIKHDLFINKTGIIAVSAIGQDGHPIANFSAGQGLQVTEHLATEMTKNITDELSGNKKETPNQPLDVKSVRKNHLSLVVNNE